MKNNLLALVAQQQNQEVKFAIPEGVADEGLLTVIQLC